MNYDHYTVACYQRPGCDLLTRDNIGTLGEARSSMRHYKDCVYYSVVIYGWYHVPNESYMTPEMIITEITA